MEYDFESYGFSDLRAANASAVRPIADLPFASLATLGSVGMNPEADEDIGSFVMRGTETFLLAASVPGLEILPIAEALDRYPEILERYFFKAVAPDSSPLAAVVAELRPRGYFIRVREGVDVETPLNVAFLMEEERRSMAVHNVVVLERDARLRLVAGCVSGCGAASGLHVSVDEHYVGPGATLSVTMIHEWGPDFIVRPLSGALVEDGGAFFSDYCSVRPPRDIESSPFIRLSGAGATTRQTTVVVGMPGTMIDIGGTVRMEGEGSSAELISRTANYGGTVVQSGLLVGAGKDCRGHVDCSGLILGDSGTIEAVPGLKTLHPSARMSHEAAIGRVDSGEVQYLQSKGVDESEATALIVRGFLDPGAELGALAPGLRERIRAVAELSGHGEA